MAKGTVPPWVSGLMVLVLGTLALLGIYATRPAPPRPLAPEPSPAPVHTRRLALEERDRVVRSYGESFGVREATLAAEVTGRVVWRSPAMEAGARVAAGDPLLRIDPVSYEQARDAAQAALESARAELEARANEVERLRDSLENLEEQVELARRDAERLAGLAATGETPASEADRARRAELVASLTLRNQHFGLRSAEAARETAQAAVHRAQAVLEQAETDLGRTVLAAPFAGEVAGPQAEAGDWLLPGAPVCRLVDRSSLRVRAWLPSEDSLGLEPGGGVQVVFPALPDGAGVPLRLAGVILGLEPAARSDSRSRALTALVENRSRRLPAGAFAEVLVNRGPESAVWLRPSEFVLLGETPTAFTVAEGPRALARPLVLGRPLVDAADRAWHPVLMGLEAGELLATDNLEMLSSGTPLTLLGEPAAPGGGEPGRPGY